MKTHKNFKNAYHKENFFVSYAVRGPMIEPEIGVRQDMPVLHPIKGPVKEPSPLNTRYMYEPKVKPTGIL